ncbi:MAG: NusA-like transcription termination signal-binding factor [Nanoarchaeota archaeon]|nr:NusA-like transcription termination signal-binding factor [Nanoarchaeota archaeon]
MAKVTYNVEILQFMSLFEKVTHSHLKDCFFSRDKMVFLVQEGQLGKALGKNKSNVTRLEKLINKRFKIVEFNSDMHQFIANLMAPLRIAKMDEDAGVVTITGPDSKTKGLMIGARAQNLREYESVVKKYFPELVEIKVV